MDRLNRRLRVFIAAALGGPGAYQGPRMGGANAGLSITGDAFDRPSTGW